ncbi:MAG: type toxin-antitoxin system HipA family toxin [Acidimicrobiaceae bacterium]|nr:type toxin-antitoxin system HipA family toxin [Acidimicrobiaceae bacterium]
MTISSGAPKSVYVWIWLPGSTEPVPAGVIEQSGEIAFFNYGRSYLERENAIAIYLPELPLDLGRIRPFQGLAIAGCISDAGPDAWGRRVIRYRMLGTADLDSEIDDVTELTYLLESASDRIGAIDFQESPEEYVPRTSKATLAEMQEAAQRLEEGVPFSSELEMALLHGSSVGGARPKALLNNGARMLIAKFSSNTDSYPVVKAEGVAMELARRVGLNVANTEVVESMGKDVLLVERFDRTSIPGQRLSVVSALTLLELDEMFARYATYFDLVPIIQGRFIDPLPTLRELFARIVFNICVGNTDDHARNHAAFWDGHLLSLTPAFDICPQQRSGGEAVQAMAIAPGFKFSQLAGCIDASERYFLTKSEARQIVDAQLEVIQSQWNDACDAARLTENDRIQLWGRQILNPYATEGL